VAGRAYNGSQPTTGVILESTVMNVPDSASLGRTIESLMRGAFPRQLVPLFKRPVWVALAYLLLSSASHVALTAIFGGLVDTSGVVDLAENVPSYVAIQVVLSAVVYYFLVIPTLLGRTFDALIANRVISESVEGVDRRFESVVRARWLRWVFGGLPWLGIIAFIVISRVTQSDLEYWNEVNALVFLVVLFFGGLACFATVGVVMQITLSIWCIRVILRDNPITVYALHPDRSGGFGALGRFSLRLSFLALGFGAILAVFAVASIEDERIATDYLLFLMTAGYFITVPVLFYLPLHAAHQAMRRYRQTVSGRTALQYAREYARIWSADAPDRPDGGCLDAGELEARVDQLDVLRRLHQHEQGLPVWPFNAQIWLTVLLNAAVPILPTVLGLVTDLAG
jgi:hypothetical protein